MNHPKQKALEITTELVNTRLSHSDIRITTEGGEAVAKFFQAIYDKVLEITTDISKTE